MKKATDKQQYLKLKEIIGFPSPDTFTEDEKSNPVPSWSIRRMIAGLPGSVTSCRCLEDDNDFVTYSLRINTMFKEDLVRVSYESIVDENIIYLDAMAKELCDAVYKMVLEVDKEGWFKAFYEDNLNRKKKSKFVFPKDENVSELFSMNDEKYFIDKYLESMKVVSELDDTSFRKLQSELHEKEELVNSNCVFRLDAISKSIEDIIVFYAYKDCITLRASYKNRYIGQPKPHVLYPYAFCEARKLFFMDVPQGTNYEWTLIQIYLCGMEAVFHIYLPTSWAELSDKQLLMVYRLFARDLQAAGVKTLCIMKWNRLKVLVLNIQDGKFVDLNV